MMLKNFISNTNILRDLDYISANSQDSSTEFLTKNSAEICNALKSRIDPVASQDICKKLVLDKISFDHRDSISKTLLIKLGGIKPETFTLNLILDFFQYGWSYYTYWQVVDKGLTSYLVQYSEQEHAEYEFTKLSDFEFSGTKLLVSRSIGLGDLSAFELSLINNPQADIRRSERGHVFINRTLTNLTALWHNWGPRGMRISTINNGFFMFGCGKIITWDFYPALNKFILYTKSENFKAPRQDIEQFYLMTEKHIDSGARKYKISFE
jgi:hypothetical protein